MTIILDAIPMPISVNKAYRNVKDRGGRAKSRDYRVYANAVASWCSWNSEDIWSAQDLIATSLIPGKALHVRRVFFFNPERILCLDGTPRRLDLTNLTKVFDDLLFEALRIDDSFVWSDESKKVCTESPLMDEHARLEITIVDIPPLPPLHATPEAFEAAAQRRKDKAFLARSRAASNRARNSPSTK